MILSLNKHQQNVDNFVEKGVEKSANYPNKDILDQIARLFGNRYILFSIYMLHGVSCKYNDLCFCDWSYQPCITKHAITW